MGVATESEPLKKRQKLSLGANRQRKALVEQNKNDNAKKLSPKSASTSSSESWSTMETGSTTDVSSTTGTTDSSSVMGTSSNTSTRTSYTTSSLTTISSTGDNIVPAVASLENLGNTCFMNSVLQVLRFTPRFLENIAILYQDIIASEKIKKKHKPSEEEESSCVMEENCEKCWEVVKNIYRVYRDQAMLEDKYEEVASDDIMSMAVKPRKILLAVRKLNPMYEDHHQHDAQEFLRCLQCYLQDAEKEVQKFYCQLPSKLSPKVTVNAILHKFLNIAKRIEDSETQSKPENRTQSASKALTECICSDDISVEKEKVKINLFSKPTEKIKVEKSDKSSLKGDGGPKVGDVASVVDEVMEEASIASASLESASKHSVSPSKIRTDDKELVENVDTDNPVKSVRGMSSARRGRRFKPYDKGDRKKKTDESNKSGSKRGRRSRKQSESNLCAMESDSASTGKVVDGSASEQTNSKSPDQVEGSLSGTQFVSTSSAGDQTSDKACCKTYMNHSKKRLGMRGGVGRKKSAEQLFDEVKELENSFKKSGDIVNVKSDNSLLIGNTNNSSDIKEMNVSQLCDKKDAKHAEGGDKEVEALESKADVKIVINEADNDGNVPTQERSVQNVLSAILSQLSTNGIKDEGTETDSDDEDIVMQKKREKLLYQSPRRSPRKTPSKLTLSTTSQNTTSPRRLPSKLFLDVPSKPVIKRSPPVEKCDTSLMPVVILENCNYLFGENGRSTVSAEYASQCLTPVKKQLGSGWDATSNNYLKRRMPLIPDTDDEEQIKQALKEMLNSPVKSRSRFDMVERNFQGSMMLRTTCIQCESSKEREEEFHDISVPVRVENNDSEDEDDEHHTPTKAAKLGLMDLIKASTEVEKLNDDNKYFCDECKAYTEAERSIHYDVLPDILTLHLKRFSAESKNPASIVKINDQVDIPLTLPCLKYKCGASCRRPDHRYKLYGIVTHSGYSATSGHYLAYVRTLPTSTTNQLSYSHLLPTAAIKSPPTTDTSNGNVDPHQVKTECEQVQNDNDNHTNDNGKDLKNKSGTMTRKKAGVVTKLPSRFTENVVTNIKVKAFENIAPKKMKVDILETVLPTRRYSTEWFECDDETVRVFDQEEFTDLLSGESGALLGTPYLLFYHKATMC